MALGRDLTFPSTLAWRTLADSVGGRFEPGDFWAPDRVVLASPPWTLTVTQTAVAAPLTVVTTEQGAPTHLRLRVLRGEFLRPTSGLDLAPISVGGPAFYGTTRLTASDPTLAHRLFSSAALRSRIVAEKHLAIDLRDGVLRLALYGHVTESERLVNQLAIAVETLQRLSEFA